MSQQTLARLSGVSQPHISEIETGAVETPSWVIVYKLASVLGMLPSDLAPFPKSRQARRAALEAEKENIRQSIRAAMGVSPLPRK